MRNCTPLEFQEEENKLAQMYIESEEDLTVAEFTEKYASEDYKKYFKEYQKERERLFAEGIIVG